MRYERFFDGTYVRDDGDAVQVTTLRNPAGFLMRSERSGASLVVHLDDALDLFDKLGLHSRSGTVRLADLVEARK